MVCPICFINLQIKKGGVDTRIIRTQELLEGRHAAQSQRTRKTELAGKPGVMTARSNECFLTGLRLS